jgi:lysozyme
MRSALFLALCATGCGYNGATMGSLIARSPSTATGAVHSVCPDGQTVPGIDVSDYQATIDWNAVKGGGIEFAFVRVSDGTGYPDSTYDANWPGAKAAGVVRGTYQFFRSNEDPIAQADLMLQKMGTLDPGDLPPVADVESTDNTDNATRAQNLHAWLDHVQQATGMTPIIYTGGYFWEASVAADFSQYPLWHAGYTGGTCPSTIANQWQGWDFWQYSDSITVPGIPAGGVDGDEFNGTVDQLRAKLTTATPVCGDGFCGGGETHDSCPGDCPICEALPASGGEISEQGVCFTAGGPAQYMRHVTDAGEDGNLIWTHTTAAATEANFGTWSIVLSEHGHYKIEAYTDAKYAQSKKASYIVHHGSADDSHVVDQTATDGWNLVVDDVELDPADAATLHLGDNTGEDPSTNTQLVFDAIRLTRLDLPTHPGEGEGEGAVNTGEGEKEPGEVVLVPPKGASAVKGGCASTTPSGLAVITLALALVRRRSR